MACISVLTSSTSLLGHYLDDSLAITIYFLNQFAIASILTGQFEIAIRGKHIVAGAVLGPTRFRLATMSLAFASGVISAHFIDLHNVWIGPIGVLAAGRIARSIRYARK